MARALQNKDAPSQFKHVISCLGDSLTFNSTLGVMTRYFWPHVLQKKIRAANAKGLTMVSVRNYGHAGNTTQDMAGRWRWLVKNEIPDIAILFGGVNDPGNSIPGNASSTVVASPTPTTTTFSVATGHGADFTAGQYIYVGTGATRRRALIASISTDAITLADTLTDPALLNAPATSAVVRSGTQPNLEYIIQRLITEGVSRIIVANTQYLNYSSGGDNSGTSSFYAAYATLRPFQAAAVTAMNGTTGVGAAHGGSGTATVVLCDLFAYMSGIIATTVTLDLGLPSQKTVAVAQGDSSWHVSTNNQHLNVLGNELVARRIKDLISNTGAGAANWATILTV